MLKTLVLVAALVCSIAPAVAQVKPDTVHLTYKQVLKVMNGLGVIGGETYKRAAKDGGVEKSVDVAWTFSANTRKLIGRDILILSKAIEEYQKISRGLKRQYLGVSNTPPQGEELNRLMAKPEWQKLEDEIEALLEKDIGEDVYKLGEDDLRLDDNKDGIGGTTLALLDPILTKKQ